MRYEGIQLKLLSSRGDVQRVALVDDQGVEVPVKDLVAGKAQGNTNLAASFALANASKAV